MIVFCTYNSRGKFMAIFCIITGVMGLVYEITLSPMELSRLNKMYNSNSIKGENILPPYNSTYAQYQNNNQYIGNNLNNDEFLSRNTNNSVNFIYTMIIVNMVLAIILYSFIIYYGSKAYEIFMSPFGEDETRNLYGGNNGLNNGYNYNAVDNGAIRNRGENVYGLSGSGSRPSDNRRGGSGNNATGGSFVPFSGRGTTVAESNS
jgi:hypothetical protein